MQTVLLTGATGFLGYYIVKRLSDNGYRIISFIRSSSDIKKISRFPNIEFIDFSEENVQLVFQENRNITAIIHAATLYGGVESFYDVQKINITTPSLLLKYAVENEINTFINCDSFFTDYYQSYKNLEFYSLSKYQFRQWGATVSAYRNIRFINLKIFHMYGPNDSSKKFLPFIISELKSTSLNPIPLTPGLQIRDFIFVDDIAKMITEIVKNKEIFNHGFHNIDAGTGEGVTLKEFVETTAYLVNSKRLLGFGELDYRNGEIMYSVAERLFTSVLEGFKFTSLVDGLNQTINNS